MNWDEIKTRIHSLQDSPAPEDGVRQTLDAVSLADHWRRRFEEERSLAESRIQAKDEEIQWTKHRTEQAEAQAASLQQQVEALRTELADKQHYWDERYRALELEYRAFRDRMDWEIKCRVLEEKNAFLEEQLRKYQSDGEERPAPQAPTPAIPESGGQTNELAHSSGEPEASRPARRLQDLEALREQWAAQAKALDEELASLRLGFRRKEPPQAGSGEPPNAANPANPA
jgi:DNA repair exonuclease SbcCD ATPase subunit